MIDSIFIQSCYKEVRDGRLAKLINNINANKFSSIDICVFLDRFSLKETLDPLLNLYGTSVKFIFVEDDIVLNPVTRIFHFLINYETEKYKRVLLLESDCILFKHFDKIINEDLTTIDREWFIYGSKYYGNKWNDKSELHEDHSNHINGVAVYNRSNRFLQQINQIFINRGLENLKTNYDFAFYESSKEFVTKYSIDSKHILNISDYDDIDLNHSTIKPKAVIIHTKNSNYLITKRVTHLINTTNAAKKSEQKTLKRNIPVFLHIPKCAGTYVEATLSNCMTWYGLTQNWHVTSAELWNTCLKRILLKTSDNIISFTLHAYDPNNECESEDIFSNLDDPYTFCVHIENFIDYVVNMKLFFFSIVIHSNGMRLIKTDIIQAICTCINATPLFYTLFRNPFDKAKSMYNYLTSNTSKHENTHKLITSKSFVEYLISYELEDCWFIREYLSLRPNTCINDNNFQEAIKFLNSFFIEDISNADILLTKIFQDCYQISYSDIPSRFKSNTHRNKSKDIILLNYEDLEEKVQKIFDQRTHYDQKLYNSYCGNLKIVKP